MPSFPSIFRLFLRPLLALSFPVLLPACGPGEKTDAPSPESPTTGMAAPPALEAPADPVSQKIEAFTGGHTRLAWARYVGGGSDVFANYDKLQLWGIDTRDGLGIRPILEAESNYSRPLILPDGSGLLFSHKGTVKKPSGKKAFDPVIYRVGWNGGTPVALGPGYATDVWRDPETGRDWVYATDLLATDRSSIEGSKLERFPLDAPGDREKVWDRTRVSTENVQLSGDGARASLLFPWPHAGVLDLETMKHRKYQHGCWPSMAPDNSHHAWVFDGAHKNLFMFTDKAEEEWSVPVNTAPGVGQHEMYHPRWSNHVRYLTLTGPYTGETVTRSDAGKVEVYVGKFSADLRKIEDWLQVTDDESGDLFPDLWIAGGESATVAGPGTGQPAAAPTPQGTDGWPMGDAPRAFVWKNRDADNAIDAAGTRESSVEARERARFGPHFEMLTDGGHFEMDETSAGAVEALLAGGTDQPFTVELVARPFAPDEGGHLFRSGGLTISQVDGEWIFTGRQSGSLGPVTPGTASHLAVVFDGSTSRAYRDGNPVPAAAGNGETGEPGNGAGSPPVFGPGWSGSLQGIAITAGALSPETLAAGAAWWKETLAARESIPTVRLRGKLVEMTADRPVEALDTYQRGLLGYLYEVEEVLEGDHDGDRVLVMHWTILDRKPLPGFPREIGRSYELTLQPYADHPELISERQWNDLFDPAAPYFDITTPGE